MGETMSKVFWAAGLICLNSTVAQSAMPAGYWFATTGKFTNGLPDVAMGTSPAADETEIKNRVAKCANVDPEDVRQIVNYGEKRGGYDEKLGQRIWACN